MFIACMNEPTVQSCMQLSCYAIGSMPVTLVQEVAVVVQELAVVEMVVAEMEMVEMVVAEMEMEFARHIRKPRCLVQNQNKDNSLRHPYSM